MVNAVMTKKGKEKLVKARAGLITLPKISHVAFGSGGVSLDGSLIAPTETAVSLMNEVVRVEIESRRAIDNKCIYTARIGNDEAAGKKINELALIDEQGDLIAIKCFRDKVKDQGMPIVFEITDEIL